MLRCLYWLASEKPLVSLEFRPAMNKPYFWGLYLSRNKTKLVIFGELVVQGGPLQVINGVIIPISRVFFTPVTHLFSAIYRGPRTPLIAGSGAHIV